MSATDRQRARRFETWKHKEFTLASGTKAWKGARAALNLATGKVQPATSAPGLFALGMFDDNVDATLADKLVSVDLEREIVVERFANAAAPDAVLATDLGKDAYMLDDQTVTITSTGRSVAGRIWDVNATTGVAIERPTGVTGAGVASQPAAGSFVSNDYVVGSVVNGAIYDVPTTAAAATVTLPAAAADGTIAWFAADGTKNGHTVTYRDETGPTSLTTALTASKRHLVAVAKRGGKWFANAYVSP